MARETREPGLPPVGALLARPAVLVRHEVIASLREAGFDDILPAHLQVFQFPGPDGQSPKMLALRAQASKQAMNHVLHQLESGGYLVRESHAETDTGDHRYRVVRLTEQGRVAEGVIREAMARLDRQWQQVIGEETFIGLARALDRLQHALDRQVTTGR
jgi:DNA-binding MarR family transcriptional regulator